MKRKKLIKVVIILFLIILTASYLVWQNNAIEVSYFNHSDPAIPVAFNGYTVAQVSDLHNKDFGDQLIDKVADVEPDVIVVTGDVIDRNRTDIPVAIKAMEDLMEIAQVYFITGNHEIASGVYSDLQIEMSRIGIINLDNATERLEINGTAIGLIGIEDPLFLLLDDVEEAGSPEILIQNTIDELLEEVDTEFNILLSHRAELMAIYRETDVDLVFTGHAHGGQIRLPLVEGVFAPSQGFLPDYTSGVYNQNETTMIVSRGLGNSVFPLRINNRPELVVVTLEALTE